MGEVLTNGVYLPDRGERNAYDGLKGNWNTLDSIAGKVPGYDAHISDTDIHVTAADKQTWNGKADASHVHNADDVTTGVFDTARIPNLDASKITTGTIDIDRLPQGALERLVKVADQAARYALTASDVQLGDTVQQLDTGVMYVVTDVTKLDSADGYTEYTAGSATSVPWSGVTGKPADYTPASHSHGNITNDGKVGTTANKPLITGTGGAVQAGSFGNQANTFCEGNDSRLSDARTPVAHTHGKSDITNLFNSANTWGGNNTFSDLNPISLKNNNIEKGVQPTYFQAQSILFKDKNDSNVAYIRHLVNKSGTTNFNADGLEFSIANKFANSALDPTGENTTGTFRIGFWTDGQKYIYNEFRWRSSLIPFSNQTQDIGTSAYQWNNLYAKNYYYNGTAWGLDKLNRWSKGQELRLEALEDYTLPSSEVTTELVSWWGTTNFRGGFGHQYYTNGDEGCRFLLSSKDANNNNHLSAFRYKLNRAGTDSYFYGTGAQNFHLGTSTNKWKTLNGVNPGALSLPSTATTDASGDIVPPSGESSINLSGSANTYTPSNNGWLTLAINNASGNCIIVRQNTLNRDTLNYMQGYAPGQTNIYLTIPVLAGVTYYIFLYATSFVMARFALCQGNV